MTRKRNLKPCACALALAMALALGATMPARAQIPVTDIAAIAQLIAQLQQLQEQLLVAKNQLEQAQALYESLRGERGMQRLLEGVVRNYLPEDWQGLIEAMEAVSASYSALAADVHATIEAHAILTAKQIAALDPLDAQELTAARRSVALLESISRQALATTSARFGAIDELIQAIGQAEDQKAILDLQARIDAEAAMLANEANKLHVLAQASDAQARAHRQRQVERRIEAIGRLRELAPLGL